MAAPSTNTTGRVWHMDEAATFIPGRQLVIGISFHGSTAAGDAIVTEGVTAGGSELFHLTVANGNDADHMEFSRPIEVDGLYLGTLAAGGEVTIYVA